MSTKKTTERLSKSKAHRAAYVSSQISIGLPFQIRALRKQRKWDQKKLAEEAGMAQPRISLMENAGYGSFTLEVLKRLANAFDVALVVRFAPFSELIRWSDEFAPDTFKVPSFTDESLSAPATTTEPADVVTSRGAKIFSIEAKLRKFIESNQTVTRPLSTGGIYGGTEEAGHLESEDARTGETAYRAGPELQSHLLKYSTSRSHAI